MFDVGLFQICHKNQADTKLKPWKQFRVRIGQIHNDGGKKMIEEKPELNQSSQFVFSMLNNSRFVIK